MAFSTVLIEFTEVPSADEQINILEDSLGINLLEIFKDIRTVAGEAELPYFVPADYPIPDRYYGFISYNYASAVDLDYNIAGQFTLDWIDGDDYSGVGTVLITANFSGAVFVMDANSTTATITIENEVIIPAVNIVLPAVIDFFVVLGITGAPAKPLNITTLSAWTIPSTLPAWLSLSSTSGTGDTIVDVIPVGYSAMAVGDYTTTISVNIDTDVFDILINLKVLNFISNPFAPGKIHFSQELDYLKFSSTTPSTYIDFAIEIKVFKINTYEEIIYNRTYKFPLFQGSGDFHIGTIVHDLFEEIQELSDFVPDLKTNYYKSQYRPAEISVSFEEKTFGSVVPGLISLTIPMFKMVKGHKPFTTEGELTLLTVAQQEITRITPKSFIGTSFIYVGTPRIVVKKNNVIIDDFTITATADHVIYSYFRFINDLQPGDSIEIIIVNDLETRSQRFLVFQNGKESTYFFFENDNQMLEPFEFSGRRRVNPNFKHITSKKIKNLYAYESKVKTTIEESFIINTGQLGKSDYRLISELVASTNAWCSFDNPQGPYFKLDATNTKLNTQDTSSSEEDFDIEFNLLEDPYASIYPR
ncbi:MAG: hypothetical protein H7Y10_12350 [Flavobacterium sp.]|nr:hypothetical protein [Flavobacterium sp.]